MAARSITSGGAGTSPGLLRLKVDGDAERGRAKPSSPAYSAALAMTAGGTSGSMEFRPSRVCRGGRAEEGAVRGLRSAAGSSSSASVSPPSSSASLGTARELCRDPRWCAESKSWDALKVSRILLISSCRSSRSCVSCRVFSSSSWFRSEACSSCTRIMCRSSSALCRKIFISSTSVASLLMLMLPPASSGCSYSSCCSSLSSSRCPSLSWDPRGKNGADAIRADLMAASCASVVAFFLFSSVTVRSAACIWDVRRSRRASSSAMRASSRASFFLCTPTCRCISCSCSCETGDSRISIVCLRASISSVESLSICASY
mmetsp:Transcript_33119/g.93751  ORF Transcript_33119/g.93751 Transcript_33119/m.93751 type:complete len:317 (-) Transcript_33119:1576-2526(-)